MPIQLKLLGVLIAPLLTAVAPAQAAMLSNSTGLASPGTSLTFDELVMAPAAGERETETEGRSAAKRRSADSLDRIAFDSQGGRTGSDRDQQIGFVRGQSDLGQNLVGASSPGIELDRMRGGSIEGFEDRTCSAARHSDIFVFILKTAKSSPRIK